MAIVAMIFKTVGFFFAFLERLPQPRHRLSLLSLFSGVAMGLTSAPTNLWPLAWIAQAPLWFIILRQSRRAGGQGGKPWGWGREQEGKGAREVPSKIQNPKSKIQNIEVFGMAFLWGVGYYGTTLIWITGLHPLTWMGIPWMASVAIAFTCWLIITLWGCLWSITWAMGLTWMSRRFFPSFTLSQGLSRVLVGTALWCGLDTLWSQGILYWPTLAFTQSPHNLWILQLNQLSGPITTTAIIAAVNGLLAEAWIAYHHSLQRSAERQSNPAPFSFPTSRPYLLTAIMLSAIAHLLGAVLYVQRSPNPNRLTVSNPPPTSLIPASTSNGMMSYAIDLDSSMPNGLYPSYGTVPTSSKIQNPKSKIQNPKSKIPLTIGLIQGNIPTADKLTGNGIRQAFNRYTESYGTLADQGADMVLMPEGALPVLWQYPSDEGHPLVRAVKNHQVPAIVGTFVPAKSDKEKAFANTITQSLLTLTNGESNEADVAVTSQYNKVKLVPLGEYIPAEGILGTIINRMSPIQSTMVPGAIGQRFETPFGQAIAGICYESAFPELFRRQAALGGEFIITASNNDPYNGAMMAQHHAQDVMRAIESDRWAVRVTNTGYSGVVNHRGQTMWRSERNTYETYIATIHRRQTRTLYTRWGNWLTLILAGLAIIAVGIASQRSRQQV